MKLPIGYGHYHRAVLAVAVVVAGALAGCAAPPTAATGKIDIFTYAPALDVQGRVYDTARYYGDLDECRRRALRAGEIYASLHEAGGEEETGFSPVAVVDTCMAAKGYALLSRQN